MAKDATLIMVYEKMQTAKTALQFLRAWANYMLYVDKDSIEGLWALKASEEFQAALAEVEQLKAGNDWDKDLSK